MTQAPAAKLIDVRHLGRERVIGCWDLGGVLVDPGPESCLEVLLEGIVEEPRVVLLTHIHLDHAGATGALVERFPSIEVWVHELGAPHMVDPARLVRSARRLYGDGMDRLWGRVVAVPESNVRVLRGGETVEAGGRRFEVAYTPGHASHHVVYVDRTDGTAYVGDVAGVRIPPADFVLAPTPPPDIDLPAWRRSLELVAGMRPERLALTHFGATGDVTAHLERVTLALEAQERLAREVTGAGFVDQVERRLAEACDGQTAQVYVQAAPPEQLWLGLERYLEKQEVASPPGRA